MGVVTGEYEDNGYVVDTGGTTTSPRDSNYGCFQDEPFTDSGLIYASSGDWHVIQTADQMSASDTGGYAVQKTIYRYYTEDDLDCFDVCYYETTDSTESISACDETGITRDRAVSCSTSSTYACDDLDIP